ncbi:conserved hypothetical protein [Roseibium sp. TrichSKD4]|uniref:DUF1353 domain-containing protein n=1 Tax=Roseibium sp. TrichSKD4 TaxID=744980 RepID=UPI0001E57550|nr:DUF1353 domain-containing protein [Roseibium sp. TrichSKD4]EFO29368.1 conserved hypothetical protein [Roseibium sp. TrichSKD4]
MSSFSNFDQFSRVPITRKLYRLNAPLTWEIGKKHSGHEITLETGTAFDISVPWLLEWLQSPYDRQVLPAAALHDEFLKRGYDVGFASAEFRRCLIARGCSPPRSWMLFTATLIWTAFGRFFRS